MLSIVGFGSGAKENMTLEAVNAIEAAELVVGFGTYVALLRKYFSDKQFYETGMLQERERCAYALKQAKQGKQVALVCSGDSGIYGMAGLIYEMAAEMDLQENIEIRVVSGVTAASSGAALLGAPLSHDFAVISLSDCLTPWELIEKRLRLAAQADLVICIYNPASKRRADYLKKACDILLAYKSADTVCGYVKNIGRNGQETCVLTLEKLRCAKADMFTTVYVGNSRTKNIQGMMVTPRGYRNISVMGNAGKRIVIFAGTTEGRQLCEYCIRRDMDVYVYVATDYGQEVLPAAQNIHIHVGRLNQMQMEAELERLSPAVVLDATHPYAEAVTAQLRAACAAKDTQYLRILRENVTDAAEMQSPNGGIIWTRDIQETVDCLNQARFCSQNILLTTGSKNITDFQALAHFKERVYLRILPNPQVLSDCIAAGVERSHMICMQGPFLEELNLALIRQYQIGVIVTKNSGKNGGFAQKCAAAARAGIPVVVMRRPGEPEGISVKEAMMQIEHCLQEND